MKKIFVVFIFISAAFAGKAQQTYLLASAENNSNVVSPVFQKQQAYGAYQVAMPPGLKMRNTGRTLTILGSALFLGGVIVFSSADEKYYNSTTTSYGTTTEGDPKAVLGFVMMAGGLGMGIPGVIFWSKGSKKYNRFLEQNQATTSLQLNGNGLSLKYRF